MRSQRIKPSARGELEITDTIQWLHRQRLRACAPTSSMGDWIDTGKHDDLLAANRIVLESLPDDRSGGAVDEASTLHGRVVLQPGCKIVQQRHQRARRSSASARAIENAYIGPFTSIGPDCQIVESEIAGSVVMENTTIERLGHRIEQSLIGRNVELHRRRTASRAATSSCSATSAACGVP